MCFLKTICLNCLVMFNLMEINGLLMQGYSNPSDQIHGSSGHVVDTADIMQILLNQTIELEDLKQKVENDRASIEMLESFKQQAENYRPKIQLLQNRVIFLEAELRKLNASKTPSTQELSTFLMSMNRFIQNMAENEENDKNSAQHLNIALIQLNELKVQMGQTLLNQFTEMENYRKQSESERINVCVLQNITERLDRHLDDLTIQVRYTSLSLLDVQTMAEKMNRSMVQLLEERISDVLDQITNVSTRIGFTAGVSTNSSSWNSGTLVFSSVITNEGKGYNPSDGVFTAPIAGVYVFFVNVQSYGTQEIYVVIVLNGATKVGTMAYTSNDAGPNLAVLSLQIGDRVWVKHQNGQGYLSDGGQITTFSGFLI